MKYRRFQQILDNIPDMSRKNFVPGYKHVIFCHSTTFETLKQTRANGFH